MADSRDPFPSDVVEETELFTNEPIPVARPVLSSVEPIPDRLGHGLYLANMRGRTAWVDVASLILLIVAFEFLAGTILFLVAESMLGPPASASNPSGWNPERTLVVPTLAVRAVGAVLIIVLILRVRKQRADSVGLELGGFWMNVLVGFGATLVLYAVILLTMLLLWLVWPDIRTRMEQNAEGIMALMPNLSTLGFVLLAALIGLYEELIFRGFLMTRLRRATGTWVAAVVLTSALFVGLHAADQVSAALIPVAILSLMFSLLTIWRRSIIPAVVAHTLWNLSMFLMLKYSAGSSWT